MQKAAANYDRSLLAQIVSRIWDNEGLPTLADYVRIPCISPLFTTSPSASEHMDQAVHCLAEWARQRPFVADVQVHRLDGRTPMLVVDVAPSRRTPDLSPTLIYGHFDKQPPGDGWAEGLDAFTPTQRHDRLYGRGAADDGYSVFAALIAVQALNEMNVPYGRCLVLIEASEESGSRDLPAYLRELGPVIGTPRLIVCLDADCISYDRLWVTTSLRGVVSGILRVDVLEHGVHSGIASGVVPSSFRILRNLLDRVEDSETGRILLTGLWGDAPDQPPEGLSESAGLVTDFAPLPTIPGLRRLADTPVKELRNRAWSPAMAVTGASGLPALEHAGNVLRPYTALKLSFRVSPTADITAAISALSASLTRRPPYGARVSFDLTSHSSGWVGDDHPSWLANAIEEASCSFYGASTASFGDGASIPFMSMLREQFPSTPYLVTGLLGPNSNAHGPDENLYVPAVKALTASVAHVLSAAATGAAGSRAEDAVADLLGE